MHEIKEMANVNKNIFGLPDGDLNPIKPKRTLAQRCKENNAITHSEFAAEWMRQLELRYKNIGNKYGSIS